jgi:iron complex outermembrane receptor protein
LVSPTFSARSIPAVGLYVDGVYIARSLGAVLDLLDVERVEVLRGPQGTLFGRNTIGGAVSLTSQKPDAGLGGRATLIYGDDNRIEAKGMLNVPLTDTVDRAAGGIARGA